MTRDQVMGASRIKDSRIKTSRTKASRVKAEQHPLKPQFNRPPQEVIIRLRVLA